MRAFDLFCGAGGSSRGAALAGAEIVGGVDFDKLAAAVYSDNFPEAVWVGSTPAEKVDTGWLRETVGPVDLLLASPDCTSHTHARGARPPNDASRDTALQVTRYAAALRPRWIVIENVVNIRRWKHYGRLLADLEGLGYGVTEQVLNAADFGVPQKRRRLFLLCRKGAPPSPVALPQGPQRSARSVIAMDSYRLTPLETERRAAATIARADRAVSRLGPGQPFLLVYYGSDRAGGWQRLDAPLRTVTTVDRFAFVSWQDGERVMRMLQVPELALAMGFGCRSGIPRFRLDRGTRRDRVRLLGNAVCPPVMEAIIRHLAPEDGSPAGATSGFGLVPTALQA